MLIGFLIDRLTNFKTMGALINEALLSDEVALYYDEQDPLASHAKSYLAPLPQKFPAFSNGTPVISPFDAPADLAHQIQEDGIEALILHQGYHSTLRARGQGIPDPGLRDVITGPVRDLGVRVVSLSSHFYDHLMDPLESLEMFDVLCITSPFSRELHLRILTEEVGRGDSNSLACSDLASYYDSKTIVTSSPMFDQIPRVDAEAVRAKYGIPLDKQVVVFFMPYLNDGCYWRHIVASGGPILPRLRAAVHVRRLRYIPSVFFSKNIDQIVVAVRNFCDRENAVLVVKSRPKQITVASAVSAADVYVDGTDDEYYPIFTGYQLMAMADLCIHASSFAGLEAVVAGVSTICLEVPWDLQHIKDDWRAKMGFRELVSRGRHRRDLQLSRLR